MKFYEAKDFEDNTILKSQDRQSVILAFKERYPGYDLKYVDPFIYEIDIQFTECIPEYEGFLRRHKWEQGKVQYRVCEVIRHIINSLGND